MENHKIVLSTEFVNDYSRTNNNTYVKGTHRGPLTPKPSEPDPDKVSACSKFEESLTECIKNYYKTFLEGEQENVELDKPVELLKCGNHFKDYENCVKKF